MLLSLSSTLGGGKSRDQGLVLAIKTGFVHKCYWSETSHDVEELGHDKYCFTVAVFV